MSIAINLNSVTKKYTLQGSKPTLIGALINKQKPRNLLALRNINLSIKHGDQIGIIGSNGSGKTTLLKIIAGITSPTKGKVLNTAKTVSIIDLEAGFHPDLSGRENVFLNGLLLGMSRSELQSKIRSIVAFAEVKSFINMPLYTYSQGMRLRLGFAICIHTNPDVLILDENYSIGDRKFQRKSYQKIQSLLNQGKTLIIVSHNLKLIASLCHKVLWLKSGKIYKFGSAKQVINYYKQQA